MQSDEAKILLGLPPDSLPSQSQIKSAYRRKVWETHPDRFPPHLKAEAESKFKLLSEAYAFFASHSPEEEVQQVRAYLMKLYMICALCLFNSFILLGMELIIAAASASTSASSYSYYRSRVVRSGVPSTNGRGRDSIRAAASLPFLLIICGALGLAGSTASRAYRKQKEAHPGFNPFLP